VEPITPTKPETPSAKAERPESSETSQKGRTLEPQPSKRKYHRLQWPLCCWLLLRTSVKQ